MKEMNSFEEFVANTYHDYKALFMSIAKDNTSSYFYFGDMQKNIFYVSDNTKEDFGFNSNIVPALTTLWADRIVSDELRQMYLDDLDDMLKRKREIHDLRYQVEDVYGNRMWIRCYGILKWDEKKEKPLFFSGRISHQDPSFVVDMLSNFPREYTGITLINDLIQNGKKVTAIGFSLNNIFEINNTKDRMYTDSLIREICGNLNSKLASKMHFYRLEGIRFMAVVNSSDICETKEDLVRQIREIVDKHYKKAGITSTRSCSFGVIEYPMESMSVADLLESLVFLIKKSKTEQSLDFLEFSNNDLLQMQEESKVALTINSDIVNEMKNFRIVVQPVVSTDSEKIIGGEVLLRWKYEGRDVSPGIFIPILEKNNMIQMVGRWVFEEAVKACVTLRKHNSDFYLTFNVSLHQLADAGFLIFMKETLDKYGLEGKHLVAELTESSIDEHPKELQDFVNECSNLGMKIALDDFGSGYSSLRMLLQYPTSIIKIDRSLLSEMSESKNKNNFITSIVYSCHQFGKTVCMEGVETETQKNMIVDAKCDMIQGFYYHRPQEIASVEELLKNNK